MKSNNIVEDRYILSSLSDDAMLFCFGWRMEEMVVYL
jgi:hypothetical protein